MSGTTHLAGPTWNFEGRIIQRCAVCGEKLVDFDPSRCAISEGGTVAVWKEADLIEVEGNRSSRVGEYPNCLPDNFCLELVEF